MKKSSLINDYLQHYAIDNQWDLMVNDIENIAQVVVIPAYAEKALLFHTLASLAKNSPSSLEYSLVLCVVNNKANSPLDVKENNQQTLECLDALVGRKSIDAFSGDQELYQRLSFIADAGMKLAYVNASSQGCEIPMNTGGVGTARKIGMDMALRLLKDSEAAAKVIISLDADTLMQENYLSAIHDYFNADTDTKTAIVDYEHQFPQDALQQAAITCYEIFLRYWVLGLAFACSPWAFHSIGSTIAVSTEAYLEVRGMNRKEAGEDFYFLNKLAKVGKIDSIKETRVYPSARPSSRVPFGTGKRIQRFLSGVCPDEYCLYDPRVFAVLGDWLQLVDNTLFGSGEEILSKAELIHPQLKTFLMDSNFPLFWSKIHRTAKDEKTLSRHFLDWFDGFRTLKMINYFTREVYPQINMFRALESVLEMSGRSRLKFDTAPERPPLHEQIEILRYLRKIV